MLSNQYIDSKIVINLNQPFPNTHTHSLVKKPILNSSNDGFKAPLPVVRPQIRILLEAAKLEHSVPSIMEQKKAKHNHFVQMNVLKNALILEQKKIIAERIK